MTWLDKSHRGLAIKLLTLMLSATLASCPSALAANAAAPASAVKSGTVAQPLCSQPIGSACSRDPSCVIVGKTHMLVWRSPKPSKVIVVCVHGLGLCARAYKPIAEELSAAGVDGYGVNVRGFGPDRDQAERAKLDCVDTVEDVCALLEQVRQQYAGYRVVLLGESMGGALVVRLAAEHPDLIDGVVCSAPAWKILKLKRTAVKGVVEVAFFPHSRPGPAGRGVLHQATTDPSLTDHLLDDKAHKLKLSVGEAAAFLGFIRKTDHYARHINKPILVLEGLNDHLVSPKAVARMFRDLPSQDKTFLIDAEGEHLLLEEGQISPACLKRLVSWIKSSNDAGSSSRRTVIEVVNDKCLTAEQEQKLSRLCSLARGHSS